MKKQKEKVVAEDLASMSLAEALNAINKDMGENTVVIASQAANAEIEYVSTGIYALDFALRGGIPKNRITEIRGPFSSFKSTTALLTIRSFQQNDPEGIGVYVDVERSFDRLYAKRLGVDLDRLVLVNPDSGEQAIDALAKLFKLSFDIFGVLDSLAALVPTAELDASMEQQSMGLQARLINRALKVFTARMKKNLYDNKAPATTLLLLNQLREKVGVVYGNPEFAPGGKGKEFYASTIIRMSATPSNAINEAFTNQGIKRNLRIGQTVEFRIPKNKCGIQGEEGAFTWYERSYKGNEPLTCDNYTALYEYGLFHNVLEDHGNSIEFDGINYGAAKRLIQTLRENSKVAQRLYTEILKALRPQQPTKKTGLKLK